MPSVRRDRGIGLAEAVVVLLPVGEQRCWLHDSVAAEGEVVLEQQRTVELGLGRSFGRRFLHGEA